MSDQRPDSDRHVYNHDADKDDKEGVAAIIHAFIKNPGGALQLVLFIGSLYGVYYAMQAKIKDVHAAQLANYEHLNSKLEVLQANDIDEKSKIEAVFARGDQRYASLLAKLSSHDVDIAKIVSSLDFLVDQYKVHEGHDTERSPARVSKTPVITDP